MIFDGRPIDEIKDDEFDGHDKEKIIQNIIVSYIQGKEDLGNLYSLISILLSRRNYDELYQVIWFIWTLREGDIIHLREKVFEIWPKLLENIDFSSKEGRKLASQLCHWALFIDSIDTNSEKWLMQIAAYAEEDYNTPDLLEALAKISESQAVEAQKIWLKMLENYSHDYPPDTIERILRNIYALGPDGVRMAKEVVDAYLKYGIERPRDILHSILESAS